MANSVAEIETAIISLFCDSKVRRKVDWSALESLQRDILRGAADGVLSTRDALVYMDEVLAAVTRRGNCLPKGFQS